MFDFWQAKSDKPTPLVLLIHGGGWRGGDKTGYGESCHPPVPRCRNFRSCNQLPLHSASHGAARRAAGKGDALYDAARAIQTLRSKAKEWNIDPTRVASTGGSAGACTSLWIAMHDDLAKPEQRRSDRARVNALTCAAVTGPQTSLDPVQIREWISNAEYGGHAFGFMAPDRKRPEEFALLLENRDKLMPLIKEYSPIEHVSKDDPPIYMSFPNQKSPPEKGRKEVGPDTLRDVRRRS